MGLLSFLSTVTYFPAFTQYIMSATPKLALSIVIVGSLRDLRRREAEAKRRLDKG